MVNVTLNDIKYGKPYSTAACPLALALRRCLGSFVEVGPSSAIVKNGRFGYYIEFGRAPRRFVRQFDRGRNGILSFLGLSAVRPRSFTLSADGRTLR